MSAQDQRFRRTVWEAARWKSRLTAGATSGMTQVAHRAWLEASPAHRLAWTAVERLWNLLAELPPEPEPVSPRRRGRQAAPGGDGR